MATLRIWDGSTWNAVGGSLPIAGVTAPLTQVAGVLGLATLNPLAVDGSGNLVLRNVLASPVSSIDQATSNNSLVQRDGSGAINAASMVVDNGYSNGAWAGGAASAALWKKTIAQTDGTKYALMTDATGNTYVNALSGQTVWFRNANTTIATVDQFGIMASTGKYAAVANSFRNQTWDSDNNYAALWRNDQGAASYTLMHHTNGTVLLNSPAGDLRLRQAGSDVAQITSQGLGLYANMKIIGNGAVSSYGTVSVQGGKNSWSGINIRNPAGANLGTLMTDGTNWGFYNAADNNWVNYSANGVWQTLTATSVTASGTINASAGNDVRWTDASGSRYGRAFHSNSGNNHIDTFGGGAMYLNWFAGGSVVVGNGAGANGSISAGNFNGGIVIGRGTAAGQQDRVGGIFVDDTYTYRTANTGTGVIYFGVPLNHYLFFDGTNYQMANGDLYVKGIFVSSAGWAKRELRDVAHGHLANIRRIAPKHYRWHDQAEGTPDNVGFVREDIAAVYPDSTSGDLVGAGDEAVPGGYRTDHLVAYLWQAVRELAAEVDELKAKVA